MAEEKVLLTMRLPRSLRDQFQSTLERQDEKASQVLRRAIRAYIQQHAHDVSAPTAPPSGWAPAPVSSAAEPPVDGEKPSSSQVFAGFAKMCGLDEEEE